MSIRDDLQEIWDLSLAAYQLGGAAGRAEIVARRRRMHHLTDRRHAAERR